MHSHKLALLAGVSMLVGGTAAEAAVVTETVAFSLSPSASFTGFNGSAGETADQTLNFDQFDPSLGTLLSVTFTDEGSYSFQLLVDAPNGGSVSSTGDFTLSYSHALIGSLLGPVAMAASCAFLSADCPASDDDSGPTSGVFGFGAGLTPFIGVGTWALDVEAAVSFLQSSSEAGQAKTTSFSGSWAGTFVVDYTYEPVREPGGDVPEPATLALVGLGAAGLAAARRRA